jgi:general secretion pathway protein J
MDADFRQHDGANAIALPSRGRSLEAGFTLVEMLVSLAVMGMAAWLLTAGIERIARGMAVAQRRGSQLDTLATAQFLLRQRLALIQPVADPQAAGKALDFTGQAESLDFIGPAADRAAPDALQHYRLLRDPDGDLVLLSLSTLDARVDPRSHQTQGWAPLTLIAGTTRIAIRYLGQNPQVAEQHAVWQANWSHRASLPLLVRISVDFAASDRQSWPDLVVHPRAATPQPCARDALTGGCAALGTGSS